MTLEPLCLQKSFKSLHHLLEVAQRVSPVAMRAVVGTKADLLDNREVTTQEALVSLFHTSLEIKLIGVLEFGGWWGGGVLRGWRGWREVLEGVE
jgi:hypothetical protein